MSNMCITGTVIPIIYEMRCDIIHITMQKNEYWKVGEL